MKPIFSGNTNYNKTAFLNWRIENGSEILNMINMAQGYLDASIMLAKHCLLNNERKKADIIIFPILTNANHGIELYLKSLGWLLNILIDSEKRIEGKHNIKQIFQNVKGKFRIYKGTFTLEDFNSSTTELNSYINELFINVNFSRFKQPLHGHRTSIAWVIQY
jgi:hypothetical protein